MEYIKRSDIIKEYQTRKLEKILDGLVKKVILERKGPKQSDRVPHKNTGINVLESVLKKIIPSLEDSYKSLTSSKEQRLSFRVHILNAIKNLLLPEELNSNSDFVLKEEVNLNLTDKYSDPSKLIKVDDRFDPKEKTPEEIESEYRKKNTIPDADPTGANFAFQALKQISGNILENYEILSNPEDKNVFFEYLITNLKLYFNKFEEELSLDGQTPEEPTTDSYEELQGQPSL